MNVCGVSFYSTLHKKLTRKLLSGLNLTHSIALSFWQVSVSGSRLVMD